uniref:mannitol 2-dehydrogenase n=1 Tax=Saccharina japonica TaxID=88149 RepID=R9UHL6_SACJA|nr:mannitol dehydrogenase [Saccharina japonica]
MSDFIDALNLITSHKIHELYARQDTEDPLVLRKKAADFRKGYGNWRSKKSKGARGETNYPTDKDKLHATDAKHEELVLDVVPLTRVNSVEMLKAPDTPGSRGVSRRGSLFRCNSIIDGNDLEAHQEKENWLKFYVNPYSGMAEAELTEPVALNQANLEKVIPATVVKPQYARPGDGRFIDHYMCHMGVGGFHRSHQAVYTDDLLNLAASLEAKNGSPSDVKKWGIVGIGLMPWDSKMYNILKAQDHLYTLLSRGHTGSEARVVGSIVDFMFAPENHQAVIDKLAHVDTRIVSLTMTEKGYCQDVNGDLDRANALVKSDLDGDLAKPSSAIGMIVAALRKRKQEGTPSFTVLSCDNLPENGDKIKHVVLQMAGYVSAELREWVESNTTFPNTMVDRITPMTEVEHIELVARDYMVKDSWPVIAEDFSQWVVEDNFCNGMPEWDKVGALVVKDVKPYEFMKLRLLNGGHSCLSYISVLCGYNYVDDAMANPLISGFIFQFFNEMSPTLLPVPGVDTLTYQKKLVERFGNPYIKDKLTRLAKDGSKKMANTLKEAVIELSEKGLSTKVIALANAAWIRYMVGRMPETGEAILGIKDPAADELRDLAVEALDGVDYGEEPKPERYIEFVFGAEIVELKGFVGEIKDLLRSIVTHGALTTLEDVMAEVAGKSD